jgi:hypothetical protein
VPLTRLPVDRLFAGGLAAAAKTRRPALFGLGHQYRWHNGGLDSVAQSVADLEGVQTQTLRVEREIEIAAVAALELRGQYAIYFHATGHAAGQAIAIELVGPLVATLELQQFGDGHGETGRVIIAAVDAVVGLLLTTLKPLMSPSMSVVIGAVHVGQRGPQPGDGRVRRQYPHIELVADGQPGLVVAKHIGGQ